MRTPEDMSVEQHEPVQDSAERGLLVSPTGTLCTRTPEDISVEQRESVQVPSQAMWLPACAQAWECPGAEP